MVQKKIGILGGGQLGRMFIQNALNYPVKIHVLDPNSNAPCAAISDVFVQGDFNDYDDVMNFGNNLDIITIEIEHVNVDALEDLEKKGKTIIPSPKALRIINDKLKQKEFYIQHQIPTAPLLSNNPKPPFVQKTRTGGYDGKGVQVIKNQTDIAKQFSNNYLNEQMANINKELAVIVAKNNSGQTIVYDVVEQVFNPEYNLLDYLLTPAQITSNQKKEAQKIALTVVEKLDSVGIFAIELFLNQDGSIWVNETAPRTHNSGHATIEACNSSQFDALLRTILNLPLVEPNQEQLSAIVNIIGDEHSAGKAELKGAEQALKQPNIYLHWYGKELSKPGRKMGHCSIVAKDLNELKQHVNSIKNTIKVNAS